MVQVLWQLPTRKIAPNPKTNPNPNPNPNRRQISSGAMVWLPPTLKLTIFLTQTPTLTGSNFPRGAILIDNIFY